MVETERPFNPTLSEGSGLFTGIWLPDRLANGGWLLWNRFERSNGRRPAGSGSGKRFGRRCRPGQLR